MNVFTSVQVFSRVGVRIWDSPKWRERNKERGMWVTESLSLSLLLLSGAYGKVGFEEGWGGYTFLFQP